jgi:NAD(P)-dependent dehydrogenase (short-subunit alcohol dehydrogenase family)
MDLQLRGKRAVVTGGSRGIGRAIARQLLREGVSCAIVARDADRLRAAADELSRGTGGRVVPLQADMRRADEVKAMVDRAAAELGGLEILVNAAARVSGAVPEDLANCTDELIMQDFEEKYLGYLRAARAAIPHLKASGWGRILNVAGGAARTAGPLSGGARNAAVVHLTKTLSQELGAAGINANAIHPATTVTEGLPDRLAARAARQGVTVDQLLAQMGSRNAIGRLVTAEEIGYVAAFLCSPLAAGITGEAIAVGGGVSSDVRY